MIKLVKEVLYGEFDPEYTPDDISRYNLLNSLMDIDPDIIKEYQEAELHTIKAKNEAMCKVYPNAKIETLSFGSSAFKDSVIYTVEV